MKLRFAGILLALAIALVGFAMPAAAHDENPNAFLWRACAMGVTSACPILQMDAMSGDPEAQYTLGLVLLTRGGSERAEQTAAMLIYASMRKGYEPAVQMWRQYNQRATNTDPRTPARQAPAPEIVVAQRE